MPHRASPSGCSFLLVLAGAALLASGGCASPLSARGKPPMATIPADVARDLGGDGAIAGEADLAGTAPDLDAVTSGVRAKVREVGGRIQLDEQDGEHHSNTATMVLRVPPEQLAPVADWIAAQLSLTRRAVSAVDVSGDTDDLDAAIHAHEITLQRLTDLAAEKAGNLEQVLELEREMTRVRGELEELAAHKRSLTSQVRLAVIRLELRRTGYQPYPEAVVYAGPRASMMYLATADGRDATRLGVGATMHLGLLHNSIEADFFEAAPTGHDGSGAAKRAALVTWGMAGYSRPAGGGKRSTLNPYLGMRLGWGFLEQSSFVLALDAGMELLRLRSLLIDVNVRAVVFTHSDPDVALVPALNVSMGF